MPRRWTDLDTDTHRLPDGFTRAGYDSNTRRYHFRDSEGRMYQGEPGEEFGGRLTPMNAIDPSTRHLFAPDDDEVQGGNLVDIPRNSTDPGGPRPASTAPARRAVRTNPQTASSFSDILSSNQMAAAPSSEPPPKKPQNRGLRSSLRRVGTLVRFRSTKSKARSATLPSRPPPEVDEWGLAQF